MILEYEKIQSVYAHKDCEHVVNGIIVFDDLIETKYVPQNFSAETKYFYLRDKHVDWDIKHRDEEIKIHEQWLEELGYDTETHYVDFETHKITKRILSTDDEVMFDTEETESAKI